MDLAKLNIQPLPPSGLASEYPKGINVLFNPNSYSITKTVSWTAQAGSSGNPGQTNRDLDAPPLVFGGGGSRTLSLQLLFDVTEPRGGAAQAVVDVRAETNKLVALSCIDRQSKVPPVCLVTWGQPGPKRSDFPFQGVITSLTQNFTLFRSTGEPVRANLTVVFTEFIDPESNKHENDPDLTTYVVKRGDSLSAIAAKLYGNAAQWRAIARANSIDDVRNLSIGVRLAIPKLM